MTMPATSKRPLQFWAAPLLALVLATSALAGCSTEIHEQRFMNDGPHVFSIDHIRHWFEGDNLIVNVTFTNRANYTAGVGTFTPAVSVIVYPSRINRADGPIYGQTSDLPTKEIMVNLEPQPGDPWHRRWNGSLGAGSSWSVAIPPGRTLQMEFEFHVIHLDDSEGYYSLKADIVAGSIDENGKPRLDNFNFYNTGCFNRDTPEFYGVQQGKAACYYWDCAGDTTYDSTNWDPEDAKRPNFRPVCAATNATGPFPFRPPTWGSGT